MESNPFNAAIASAGSTPHGPWLDNLNKLKAANGGAPPPDMSGFQGQGGFDKWSAANRAAGGTGDRAAYDQQMGVSQNAAAPPPPAAPTPPPVAASGPPSDAVQSPAPAPPLPTPPPQPAGYPPPPANGQTGASTTQLINGQRMYWTGSEWHLTPFQAHQNRKEEEAARQQPAPAPPASAAVYGSTGDFYGMPISPELIQRIMLEGGFRR